MPDTPAVRLAPAPDNTPAPSDPVRQEAERPAPSAVEALLLTADQAAALCGVSAATWYRMASGGRCPAPVRLSRGCVRWSRETLVEWIRMGCPPLKEFSARLAARNGNGRK